MRTSVAQPVSRPIPGDLDVMAIEPPGLLLRLPCHRDSFVAPCSAIDLDEPSEVIDMRLLIALSALLLSTVAALSEVSTDCRSPDPQRAVSGCTIYLQSTGTSKADQAF